MSDIHIVRDYPYSPVQVWQALTDPELVPLWTSTGRGGRPVGFRPEPGARFQFIGKPTPGWNGIVECRILEIDAPRLFRYTWTSGEDGQLTTVTYRVEPQAGGTRFTYDHTGYTGVGGFMLSALLGKVRRKMLSVGLPAVLAELDAEGHLRPDSTLRSEALG
ncbi:SRPBCC family protein [Nocardia alni]|uniref:SRPBCC family protein n=1 Tax=Nocardia alni TaxID=2815723 RepID=UPI001C217F80|nr:SRPBCC domain-containing protein [Nocardia alni]